MIYFNNELQKKIACNHQMIYVRATLLEKSGRARIRRGLITEVVSCSCFVCFHNYTTAYRLEGGLIAYFFSVCFYNVVNQVKKFNICLIADHMWAN